MNQSRKANVLVPPGVTSEFNHISRYITVDILFILESKRQITNHSVNKRNSNAPSPHMMKIEPVLFSFEMFIESYHHIGLITSNIYIFDSSTCSP